MEDHGGPDGFSGLLPNVAIESIIQELDTERWSVAEERTAELIARIQPDQPSEERRNAVASYVQGLIMNCFTCQVFMFGSVPLKTYLPDGDIDLTAFSENENLKDTWADEVLGVLKKEEKNENAEFHVKEVQYIQAEDGEMERLSLETAELHKSRRQLLELLEQKDTKIQEKNSLIQSYLEKIVKIIKCLVEDIVVDISFNQVGGLCTLCFLDEVDIVINKNHLFKRSIILIKAWCYYESRILGAHHGLISTYALETLVLYIFHVYNNSFAGPLEVLYRFLEFFSKFDWENFCVSLWGPVSIHSLADMIAEPPRKDGGELLLSKLFLDICSSVYAVFPAGQENQLQPFVSRTLNIIDPLRVRNNLGRSVSKGNFFRIRSAFTFGAKQLARLIACPKENLIPEVNQFFTNTWDRHGSGSRPDAPSAALWNLQPMKAVPVVEPNSVKGTSNLKKNEGSNVLLTGHEYEADDTQIPNAVNRQYQRIYRTNIPSTLHHIQNKKNYENQIEPQISDHVERNMSAKVPAQSTINQNNSWPAYSLSRQTGQDLFQFARGHTAPELTDAYPEVLAQGSDDKVQESRENQVTLARLNHGSRRKHMGLGDPSSPANHQILDTADSNGTSNCFHDSGEEINVSQTLDMNQEEQDLVNIMASSRVHNGQVQLPNHFHSHIPFPLSPSLIASMTYNQRNLAGFVPPPIPLVDPSWGSGMQYPHGFVNSPIPHYTHAASPNSNSGDVISSVNGGSGLSDVNPGYGDQGFRHEDDTGSNKSDLCSSGFQMFHSHDKKQIRGHANRAPSSQVNSTSTGFMSGHHMVARESEGPVTEDNTGPVQFQTDKRYDTRSTVGNGNSSFPASKTVSSRSKPGSESSSDGSEKATKSAKDKRGRRLAASAILTALYGNSRNGRRLENSSDHSSGQADDETSHARNHKLPGCELAEESVSDSVVSVPPMVVNSSQQRVVENSGAAPFAFYPTGPPVPFLAMLPFSSFPSDTGFRDGPESQFDNGERADHGITDPPGQGFSSAEVQSEVHLGSSSLRNSTTEPYEDQKSDILRSDFVNHLQNLQYVRSCQSTRQPIVYPSPIMMPPAYLQGHFSWNGPGRPPANLNLFTQFMDYGPRLVPVAPLQPGPPRNSAFQRYGDEIPSYRGGTGTYMPNPKAPFRDRLSAGTRNHRGNYNNDRNDPDREGNWNNTKSRAAGRTNGHTQADKQNSRSDRSSRNDNRANRQWYSNRHESFDSYQGSASSFGPRRSSHGSANMTYSVYSMPAVNPNGMGQPRLPVPSAAKLYAYDQGVMYGSHADTLKFGSVGLTNHSSESEITDSDNGNPAREGYQQRHGVYQGSSRSSPG